MKKDKDNEAVNMKTQRAHDLMNITVVRLVYYQLSCVTKGWEREKTDIPSKP